MKNETKVYCGKCEWFQTFYRWAQLGGKTYGCRHPNAKKKVVVETWKDARKATQIMYPEEKELEEAKEWLSNKMKEEINLLISEYMETVRPYYNKIKVPIVL